MGKATDKNRDNEVPLEKKLDVAAERESLGRLAAFSGVSRFPARVKCASLGWHAMHAALGQDAGEAAAVSTE